MTQLHLTLGSRNVTARTLEKLTQEDSPKVGRPSKAERGMHQESGNCPHIFSHHNRRHSVNRFWRWLNTALVFSALIARNYHWNWPSGPIPHLFPTVRSFLPFLEGSKMSQEHRSEAQPATVSGQQEHWTSLFMALYFWVYVQLIHPHHSVSS